MEEEGLLELIIRICTDIVITIRDNGVGMAEERLRNIMANMILFEHQYQHRYIKCDKKT